MRDYIIIDKERIHLGSMLPYQVYINGRFISAAETQLEHKKQAFMVRQTLRALGISYTIRWNTKNNIIDGYQEVHNFKTIEQ